MDGGGDHCNGGGGYTGGGAESLCQGTENGLGGKGTYALGGSGYFTQGDGTTYGSAGQPAVGGQGGNYTSTEYWCNESGGDGGFAGEGGNVKVSETATIYAFNGNKWTDDVKDHEYQDGLNQLEIFAQNGILRSVYKYNSHWGEKKYNNYEYLSRRLGADKLSISTDIDKATSENPTSNILIRTESTCDKLTYINPKTNNLYGIGSGAGYIEISNGTYIVDESMN